MHTTCLIMKYRKPPLNFNLDVTNYIQYDRLINFTHNIFVTSNGLPSKRTYTNWFKHSLKIRRIQNDIKTKSLHYLRPRIPVRTLAPKALKYAILFHKLLKLGRKLSARINLLPKKKTFTIRIPTLAVRHFAEKN